MPPIKNQSHYAHLRPILAFVHIEKAAGTTLVDIFRRNFCMRFAEVRPLTKASGRVFCAEDMQKTLAINPAVSAITGHAIKPFSNLQEAFPNIQYITLLRDPARRYVSHYQYWVERKRRAMRFEDFLELDYMRNFQTRKITRNMDITMAKDVLKNQFMLVGLVEQFDKFLLMLRKKLLSHSFDPRYRIANVANNKEFSANILDRYQDDILNNNELDIQLYNYVKHELIPKTETWYGPSLDEDVSRFQETELGRPLSEVRRYIYYAYKKFYLTPATGAVRAVNGLPVKGSYGVEG